MQVNIPKNLKPFNPNPKDISGLAVWWDAENAITDRHGNAIIFNQVSRFWKVRRRLLIIIAWFGIPLKGSLVVTSKMDLKGNRP